MSLTPQGAGWPLRLSTSFTIDARPLRVTPPPSPQSYPLSVEHRELRKEYREEREAAVSPFIDDAREAQQSAISFAQGFIKSGMLLNGGGIVAIPAIVTLFGLDSEKMVVSLLWPASSYLIGLLASWLAYLCAFYAMAHRADERFASGNAVGLERDAQFYAHASMDALTAQMSTLRRQARWRRTAFLTCRYVAILMAFASLVAFIVGSWTGRTAILSGPHKAASLSIAHSP